MKNDRAIKIKSRLEIDYFFLVFNVSEIAEPSLILVKNYFFSKAIKLPKYTTFSKIFFTSMFKFKDCNTRH